MNAVDTKAVKSDKLNVKITEREDEMTGLSTLCYIEKDNKYLMLHRIKKKNDVNEGKWIEQQFRSGEKSVPPRRRRPSRSEE